MTRRKTLAGMAATPLAAASAAARIGAAYDIAVIGAGVFGAWTAEALRRRGRRVVLVDAWAPAHARASSGGESRMTRGAYGPDELYTRMALASLDEWKALSSTAGLPVFHETGVLFFFQKEEAYALQSLDAHRRLGLPTERLSPKQMKARWPQIDWSGVAIGIFEPQFGALMARRSVETLVDQFVRAGGDYRRALVLPPTDGPIEFLQLAGGERLRAGAYVFACGPWLGKMFPRLLADRLFVTRQEILFFSPPAGDSRFAAPALPGWADFNEGDLYYGFPDLEGRGFKIAHDRHGPAVDPDTEDRLLTAEGLANVRAFMARRFPTLAGAPLSESRICQYENSANGDLLIDRCPGHDNAYLVGMGSGHGFKHGPEVGRIAAELALDGRMPDPRFALAAKTTRQHREVH